MKGLEHLYVRDAMIEREEDPTDPERRYKPDFEGMLYVLSDDKLTTYEQLTRFQSNKNWKKLKLIPILNTEYRILDILDLDSPRTRTRLEALVMTVTHPLLDPTAAGTSIRDGAIISRRCEFDSIHYGSYRARVTALCKFLLSDQDGRLSVIDDLFNNARADEVIYSLKRAEEWLEGYVSDRDMKEQEQRALLGQVSAARDHLVERYMRASASSKYFPHEDKRPLADVEVIVVLGCKDKDMLRARVRGARAALKEAWFDAPPDRGSSPDRRTLVLSGGGSWHDKTEAQLMLEELEREYASAEIKRTSAPTADCTTSRWYTIRVGSKSARIVLEEDSLDTLGNALFSWLTLRLLGDYYGLESISAKRLGMLMLVTDRLHAPRSYDLFRRVFAFRPKRDEFDPRRDEPEEVSHETPEPPKLLVRLVEGGLKDSHTIALNHLTSESQTNTEIFRMVSVLSNQYDTIGNGHVRSILGQMLRLHKLYKGRWDLVRKYSSCWSSAPDSAKVVQNESEQHEPSQMCGDGAMIAVSAAP